MIPDGSTSCPLRCLAQGHGVSLDEEKEFYVTDYISVAVISDSRAGASFGDGGMERMGELETCLALLFRRKGKNILTEKELVFSASMDFRWFTPKEAQKLLELGIKRGLLTKTDGLVKPNFDYKRTDIPVTYRPTQKAIQDEPEDVSLFARILDAVSAASNLKKREIVARINKIQERLGVDIEVAALALALEVGAKTDNLTEAVRTEVLSR